MERRRKTAEHAKVGAAEQVHGGMPRCPLGPLSLALCLVGCAGTSVVSAPSIAMPETDAPTPESDAPTAEPTSSPTRICVVDPPRTADLGASLRGRIGRVGDATWAHVNGPEGTGAGIATVGLDGAPQITLTTLRSPLVYVGAETIWMLQPDPAPQLVAIDVADASAPRVAEPIALPFAMPHPLAFAVGPARAVFVAPGAIFVLDRESGRWRQHAIGPDPANAVAWCLAERCFVVSQNERASGRLRPTLYVASSLEAPSSTLVADEPVRSMHPVPADGGRSLEWTDNQTAALRRRFIAADGSMPDPPTDREVAPGPVGGFDWALSASTDGGTLHLGYSGDLEGFDMARGHGHRWRFDSVTSFTPAGGAPEPPRELLRRHGGGLGGITAVPIAGPGGFAVVLGFLYAPTNDPTFWLLRAPCEEPEDSGSSAAPRQSFGGGPP